MLLLSTNDILFLRFFDISIDSISRDYIIENEFSNDRIPGEKLLDLSRIGVIVVRRSGFAVILGI